MDTRRDLPWLRLYTEILDDPKIRRLTPRERWIWIACLCIAQRSPVAGKLMLTSKQPLTHMDIAHLAGITVDDFTPEDMLASKFAPETQRGHEEYIIESALQKFESLEMITRDHSGCENCTGTNRHSKNLCVAIVTLCNFSKRQYGKTSNHPLLD